ncbi:UTP--glucose-1-phosphate uridylyltransferase GalU [Alkanindiges illinoisensis]|uniref:UTP--glucose-1-phosphate uridylyltransferase GalU n=1 Tax=Alkanindiges illinoisensis TaxID=197183 RepID=UPI000479D991|nr:UTP--glucose-1-phosphate uridylyltransferase GalU [Alkanindiges illinoisensis]
MTVKKAVLPVAGLGTRFLPASKSIPKEMVTVVDRPVIDYVVQEAIAAGIEQIILVTHSSKRAIEDYFDSYYELEDTLQKKNKLELLETIQTIIPKGVDVVAVRQPQPLGLGHAVLCAKSVIGNEPFAVLLPDVLVKNTSQQNDLQQMIAHYSETHHSQIMVEQVPEQLVSQYGIVDIQGQQLEAGQSLQLKGIVEKPKVDEAPSSLAVVGRYVLPARVLSLLEQTKPGAGGEIQLTDAIAALMHEEFVDAYRMSGKTYDCGSKLGYLEAILSYGIDHPQLGKDFINLIQNSLK